MLSQLACAFADGTQTRWTCVQSPNTTIVVPAPHITIASNGLTGVQTAGFGIALAFVLVCALALGRRLASDRADRALTDHEAHWPHGTP